MSTRVSVQLFPLGFSMLDIVYPHLKSFLCLHPQIISMMLLFSTETDLFLVGYNRVNIKKVSNHGMGNPREDYNVCYSPKQVGQSPPA